jgi:hypothetical protein
MRSLLDALGRARARRRGLAVGIAVAGATVAVVAAATGAMAWRARGPDASRSEASPRRLVGWRDERPGCACPLSACDGHCVSECDAAAFVVGDPLPGISLPNRQEALHGASSGGDVVLYLAGAGCALDRLFVARALDGTFRETDLTDQLDRAQVDLFEGCCTLTRDGQGIVMTTPARDAFVEVRPGRRAPAPCRPAAAAGAADRRQRRPAGAQRGRPDAVLLLAPRGRPTWLPRAPRWHVPGRSGRRDRAVP